MSAPTSVTVEAEGMTSATVRWSYSGSSPLGLYRSTDNSTYALVSALLSSVTSYNDTGLSPDTLYYYKLSDDAGSTYSSVVSVYTMACPNTPNGKNMNLPFFDDGQQDQAAKLNQLVEQVQNALQQQQSNDVCQACPSGGAVIIDCTDGCNSFLVIADQDINSWTINNCGSSPDIAVFVPPSTTRAICGFPPGWGFTGDECTEAPISGGTKGKTLHVSGGGAGGLGPGSSKRGPAQDSTGSLTGKNNSGGGGGGTGCECVPGENNQLALKCCTADCSMSCKSISKALLIKVCGGVGPYTFSHTGSVKFQTVAGDTSSNVDSIETNIRERNPQVRVVPPTNSGSAVAGTAYAVIKNFCYCGSSSPSCGPACGPLNALVWSNYGCDDSLIDNNVADRSGNPASCNAGATDGPCVSGTCGGCSSCLASGGPCSGTQVCYGSQAAGAAANEPVTGGTTCDKRTAGMISNGCNPCGVSVASVVITVTDATGVSVSITLRA